MNLKTPYILLLLVFVTLGVYYPTIFAPVNSVDDHKMITGLINADGFHLKGIFFPGGSGYYYRPLVKLSFWADNYLWGLVESFMHLENILLHAVNVALVFLIARRIFRSYRVENILLPFSAALLFALHPVNTEPVNWISGRTDLLAGVFILFSILMLLKALESGSYFMASVASVSFLGACLAKEVAVFFFPAALFIIYCHDFDSKHSLLDSLLSCLKRRYAYLLSFTLIVGTYFFFRHLALLKSDTGIAGAAGGVVGQKADLLDNLRVFVKLLGFYGKKLFIPWPLNFTIVHVPHYYFAIGLFFLALCIYLVYKRDLVSCLFLTSVCIVSPAFLVAVSKLAWTPVAERYLYIPCATFSIGITYLVVILCRRVKLEKVLPVAAIMIFATISYATVERNIEWQDNLTLFTDTVKKSPDSAVARNELAVALKQHGREREGNELINANMVEKNNRNKDFFEINRAILKIAGGDLEGARQMIAGDLDPASRHYITMLQKLVEIDEKRLQVAQGKRKKQQVHGEIVETLVKLQIQTGDPFYYYRLGQYHLAMGNKEHAQQYFAKAYENAPDNIYYKMPAGKLAEKLSMK
jgi:protein O-mannosyl-transferase